MVVVVQAVGIGEVVPVQPSSAALSFITLDKPVHIERFSGFPVS